MNKTILVLVSTTQDHGILQAKLRGFLEHDVDPSSFRAEDLSNIRTSGNNGTCTFKVSCPLDFPVWDKIDEFIAQEINGHILSACLGSVESYDQEVGVVCFKTPPIVGVGVAKLFEKDVWFLGNIISKVTFIHGYLSFFLQGNAEELDNATKAIEECASHFPVMRVF